MQFPGREALLEDPFVDEYVRARDLLQADEVQAREELENLAGRGSPMAMLYIADAIRTGTIYEIDLEKAEGWYLQPAVCDTARALYGIGQIHLARGDHARAVDAFSRAADMSFGPALNVLGSMYFKGEGGRPDIHKAKDLWERGASVGHSWSRRNLARKSISGVFGLRHVPRGVWLFLCELVDIPVIVFGNPHTDRLMY